MTDSKHTSHEEFGQRLSQVEGFDEGRALQDKLIRLGKMLRQLREDHLDLKQAAAAELIGMKQGELSRLESGRALRGPSFSTLERILHRYQEHLKARGSHQEIALVMVGDDAPEYAVSVSVRDVSPRVHEVTSS